MIIPYAHENVHARRWPAVTIALVVLNVVVFVFLNMANDAAEKRLFAVAEVAAEYFQVHEDLEPCPTLERLGVVARSPRPFARDELDDAGRREQTQRGRELCAAVDLALDELPTRRFGYVPAVSAPATFLTYAFLHGGWIHLLSNMWFLWLCGANLEDRWGRRVFTIFYLLAAAAAALAQKMATPDSVVPVIGASGAIAGAMGAFLVVFAKTRIKFFTIIFFRPTTFSAPAYVMMPLWLLSEIYFAAAQGDRSGVAHWVHVGGFAFGVAVAAALRYSGIERKLDLAVEREVSKVQDTRILEAGEHLDAGRAGDALRVLEAFAREEPASIDAQLEIVRAARALGYPQREADAYARLVDLYVATGALDTAADVAVEMVTRGHGDALPRGSALTVADHLAFKNDLARAAQLYALATREGLVDRVAVRGFLDHARALSRLGRHADALALLEAARASPFSTPMLSAQIDEETRKLAVS